MVALLAALMAALTVERKAGKMAELTGAKKAEARVAKTVVPKAA